MGTGWVPERQRHQFLAGVLTLVNPLELGVLHQTGCAIALGSIKGRAGDGP